MPQFALEGGSDPADSTQYQDHHQQQQQQQQYQQYQQQQQQHQQHHQQHHQNQQRPIQHHQQPQRQYYPQHHQHNYGSLPASPSSPTLAHSAFPTPSFTNSSSPVSFSRSTGDTSLPNQNSPVSAGRSALQQTTITTRSQRKQAPSPLQTSTAASHSAVGTPTGFTFPFPSPHSNPSPRGPNSDYQDHIDIPQIVTTGPESPRFAQHQQHQPHQPHQDQDHDSTEKTYFNSDSSEASTPVEELPNPTFPVSPRSPNDNQSVSDPVVTPKPLAGATISSRAVMAGSSTMPRAEPAGPTRNASVDSGVSALSNSSITRKNSADSITTHDIPSIIKAAGSAEAVIGHLLKEKQAQVQQNAQLWRLVDKQRAMILGLNKDLERALKDKEKYRRKVKELLPDKSSVSAVPSGAAQQQQPSQQSNEQAQSFPNGGTAPALSIAIKDRVIAAEPDPASPISIRDSPLQSPVDVTLAPYPITPPADQQPPMPSAIGHILDPMEMMPRPQDHALDHYDHEAEERRDDSARRAAADAESLPISFALPPSRSLPSKPPQVPPPQIPAISTTFEDGTAHFSALTPPPRKPPPAPLLLRDVRPDPAMPIDDEVLESDSDYDSLLEVNQIPETDKRGRRKTREEDDRVREVLAIREAEARSLSKKSKASGSMHATTPKKSSFVQNDLNASAAIPASPPLVLMNMPNTLDSVMNSEGEIGQQTITIQRSLAAPLLSPGLPSSPRPNGMSSMRSSAQSPPLSPRMATVSALSPRPPRQPIPLPPNTPLQTPSPANGAEPQSLTSPKSLSIVKVSSDTASLGAPSSPSVASVNSREAAPERTRIYKGFMTDEFPELLLPPNALPSIDIRVASSRMKPSRASLISLTQLEEDPVFTLAIISRSDGGELWRVEKDSASLAKLDQRLKQCSAFTARTPDRSLFSGHAPAKLDARRQALNFYLDELLNTQLDNNTAMELCRYLSTHTLPPNADETGSASAEARKEVKTNKAKINYGTRPVRNGYLTKRGKNFGGWKARFFMLDGPLLKYYETPGGAHLGTIKLQNAQIGKQSQHSDSSSPAPGSTGGPEDSDNQYRHAFLILEPKKKDPSSVTKHVLCAESDQERDLWVDTLLRWIDYRDNEDDDDESSLKDTERPPTAGSQTKKKQSQSKKQQQKPLQISSPQQPYHVSEGREALIGVGYDAMQQGDVPAGTSGTGDGSHPMSQSPYMVPAPRDPQVITEGTPWTNKGLLGAGLAAPTVDEKKVRKRSFFGFSTKTRTSADGHGDGLFGDHAGGHGNGAVVHRQVFGAPLSEAVRYNSPVDVKVPLPAVVYRCVQYLEANNALNEEGIFRLSGSNVVIKQLRERFNIESDLNLITDSQYHDIHAVASLLKMYLRELPTTILTRDLHMQFMAVTEMTNTDEKLACLAELSTRLPQANATLLKYLIAFLIRIINNADKNKMTVRNVGIVFSPTLNIPAPVFAMLLQNYEAIFGFGPEEYELPLPESEDQHNRQPSLSSMSTTGTLDPPQRPGTSNTNESPHRQRLLDAVKNGNNNGGRNTPPSQFQSRNGSTPTPPPAHAPPSLYPMQMTQQQQQRMTTFDAQFFSQQANNSSQVSLRPAYETGFVMPPGYDVTQAPVSMPVRNNPGYDRPIYESGNGGNGNGNGNGGLAPASQRNNRRESAIFPGAMGYNPQDVKGRAGSGGRY